MIEKFLGKFHFKGRESFKKILKTLTLEAVQDMALKVKRFQEMWKSDGSPLHVAAETEEFETFTNILGDVEVTNPKESEMVARNGYLLVCQLVNDWENNQKHTDHGSKRTPLHLTAGNGNLELCKLIIENVQEKNPKDNKGRTPLHYTSCSWLPSSHQTTAALVHLIMENVQDKNPKDNHGWTPLHNAAEHIGSSFRICI